MGRSPYIENPLPNPADVSPNVGWFIPTEVEDVDEPEPDIDFLEEWED